MFDYDAILKSINKKVHRILDENNRLKEEVMQLKEKNSELTENNKKQQDTINNLKEENQIIKLRNTLVQKGDSAEIKLKINQLIRNIDKSLELLTQVD